MSTRSTALRVEGLSKRYRIGLREATPDTLGRALMSWVAAPARNLRQLRRQSRFGSGADDALDVIWPLKDVSFEVAEGEVVGIVGRNGAGKSTLLKIIARITEPTGGRCVVRGRVASLLEVGTGFHQELTGRENVYLNGTILGMSKAEVDRKFDEIVEFSGVGKFIDTPVKRYSSGMQVRLAFAVGAHLEPEILLVDEVLAVGDAAFQRKCLGKISEVSTLGRTVLFVSHNMGAVRSLCRRGIWLHEGRIAADGGSDEVIGRYLASLEAGSFRAESRTHGLLVHRVVLRNRRGEATSEFEPGDDLVVEIDFEATRPIDQPYVLLVVDGIHGSCFTANMLLDGHRPAVLDGKGQIACRFKSLPLLPNTYSLRLAIRASDGTEPILKFHDVASFRVVGDLGARGYRGNYQALASVSTPVVVPYEWVLPDGRVIHVSVSS